jgi:HPt (histidine-containing phosphotransfer) domain-containing protein
MLYDLSNLKTLSNNDEAFIIDMLQTYKRTAPPVFRKMEEFAAGKKFEAAGREAHKLIPGVSFLGAKDLQDVLTHIEEAAKSGDDPEKIPSLVSTASQMSDRLIACFEEDFPGKI